MFTDTRQQATSIYLNSGGNIGTSFLKLIFTGDTHKKACSCNSGGGLAQKSYGGFNMYAKLIYEIFLKDSVCRKGNEWLIPIIHQSILYYGAEKTYKTMDKNFMFFCFFPMSIESKHYTNINHIAMIGDAWNIFFNPRLKLISPLRYYSEYPLKFRGHE